MRAFRDVVAYMGFGFYWAWIFVSFNSAGSLGQNLPIDALTSSHLVSSVAAILPLRGALCMGRLTLKMRLFAPLFRSPSQDSFISLYRLCRGPLLLRLQRRCPSLPDLAYARAFPAVRIVPLAGRAAFPKSLLPVRPFLSEPWSALRW